MFKRDQASSRIDILSHYLHIQMSTSPVSLASLTSDDLAEIVQTLPALDENDITVDLTTFQTLPLLQYPPRVPTPEVLQRAQTQERTTQAAVHAAMIAQSAQTFRVDIG
jgi:hypothetical protein